VLSIPAELNEPAGRMDDAPDAGRPDPSLPAIDPLPIEESGELEVYQEEAENVIVIDSR